MPTEIHYNIRKQLEYMIALVVKYDAMKTQPWPGKWEEYFNIISPMLGIVTLDTSSIKKDWDSQDFEGLNAINSFVRTNLVTPNNPGLAHFLTNMFGIALRAKTDEGNSLIGAWTQSYIDMQPEQSAASRDEKIAKVIKTVWSQIDERLGSNIIEQAQIIVNKSGVV